MVGYCRDEKNGRSSIVPAAGRTTSLSSVFTNEDWPPRRQTVVVRAINANQRPESRNCIVGNSLKYSRRAQPHLRKPAIGVSAAKLFHNETTPEADCFTFHRLALASGLNQGGFL